MNLKNLKIGESSLFAEAPAWVNDTEIFTNPSPYMFHQLRRHLNFSNEIRGLLTQGGDVMMWDGKTTHDQVEAQLHLGKCTQFLITKKAEFFVVQYGNDAEMKADSQAAYKNLPRPFEANPILRSLKLVFREEGAA